MKGANGLLRAKKSRNSMCYAACRGGDGVRRCYERRSGYRTCKSDKIVFGVCGNWIRKRKRKRKSRRIY